MYANRISLTGFLGKAPETKTTRNNASFTVLSLATKRSWKDRESGEYRSHTTWHRIVAWGRLADFAGSLSTGAHLQVEGELRTRDYVPSSRGATADTARKTITEVRANSIAKLDRSKKTGESAESAEGAAA